MRRVWLNSYFFFAILSGGICENRNHLSTLPLLSSTKSPPQQIQGFSTSTTTTKAPSEIDQFMNLPISDSTTESRDNGLDDLKYLNEIAKDATTHDYENEKCFHEETIGNTDVVWENKVDEPDGTLYYSKPLCIAKNRSYLLRQCNDGRFDDHEDCDAFQTLHFKSVDFCPYGLELFQGSGQYYCYMVTTSKQPYHLSKCPYNYNVFDSLNERLLYLAKQISETNTIWMDIRRNNYRGGIGQFTIYELTHNYGEVFHIADANFHNCTVLKKGRYAGESCNALHYRLCVYKPSLDWQYCKWGNITCINSDIDTSNLKCICPTATDQCKKPAELITPIHNHGIFSADMCKLHMGRDEHTGDLIWSSSKTKVNQTFWSKMELQTELEEHIVWKGFGWTSSNSEKYSCTICEVPFDYAMPKLTLSYKNAKLDLSVENENSIFRNWFLTDIFCFTDGYESEGAVSIIAKISNTSVQFGSTKTWNTGSYWCEAYEVKHLNKITSNVVTITVMKFFILLLTTKSNFPTADPTSSQFMNEFYGNISHSLEVHSNGSDFQLHWANLLDVHKTGNQWEATYIFHIRTSAKNDKYRKEFYEWNEFFKTHDSQRFVVTGFYNTEFCANKTTTSNNITQFWKEAIINEVISSETYCVDKAGNEITITCKNDRQLGARFTIPKDCYLVDNNATKSDLTEDLTNLENSNNSTEEIIESLHTISEESDHFEPIDIYLVANLLHKYRNTSNLMSIINIISNLMNSRSKVLETSQKLNNATDKILNNLDLSLKSINLTTSITTEIWLEAENIRSFVFDPCSSNYKGAAYLTNGGTVQLLNSFELLDVVQIEHLDIAAYLQTEDLDYCNATNQSNIFDDNSTASTASVTFFLSSALFNENDGEQVNVTFPKYASVLVPEQIKKYHVYILFNYNNKFRINHTKCAYWRYGTNLYGKWDTSTPDNLTFESTSICRYDHATHYGQLIVNEVLLSKKEKLFLGAITILESGLSAIGIFVIFITGLLFTEWRVQIKNQILLHYCLVLFVQMAFLFLADYIDNGDNFTCIVLGAVLHFTVLSQFVWTMMIAANQYRRYIDIYTSNEVVLVRCMFYAYGLPFLLVVIVAGLFSDTYLENGMNMCYPSGNVHIATVLVPVSVVVLCNIYIFLRIFVEMCRSWRRRVGLQCENLDFKIYLKLIVLMFFILGITWGFGILANLLESSVFLFIFSICVSIQGFIMFLFFIVFDNNVLHMYVRRLQAFSFNNKFNA